MMRMWHVPLNPEDYNVHFVKFDSLSHPYVIAIDDDQLWFLNY